MDTREPSLFPVHSACRSQFMLMKLLTTLLLTGSIATAQSVHDWDTSDCTAMSNEEYGTDEKNTFDIILPQLDRPTPLVIYIHGGGFVQGDKSDPFRSRSGDIAYFLKNKVAFASLNYRFASKSDSVGVAVCLRDIKTALQYIRHSAGKYNINKELIACYGSSAGAGSSLYLAFHDDFAMKNDTSLLGESTRIRCAGALATQATYDVYRWETIIPGMDTLIARARDKYYDVGANFYGYGHYRAFEPHRKEVTRQFDMLQMISSDDPPIYIMNLQKETGQIDMNSIQHHGAHALILADYLHRSGIEHEIYVYSDTTRTEQDLHHTVKEFLVSHLTAQ